MPAPSAFLHTGLQRLGRMLPLLLVAALASQCVVAQARSVYRWVDEDGRVHYDDMNNRGQRMTREYMARREVPEQPDWAGVIPAEVVTEVRQRCANARSRLESYRSAPEIYGRDPSGNVYRLSDTQARLMLAEIRQESAYYCGDNAARRVHADRRAEDAARELGVRRP